MAYDYNFPAYSSTHPAVAQLFQNEFAQRQGAQQALQAQAANEVARAQVAAQERLAQAQLRAVQQQQAESNLFRMQQGKQVDRQLDIDEKYKAGLTAKPNLRSAQDIEEANAASDAIASQLNGSYQTKLNAAKAALDKKKNDDLTALGSWGWDHTAKVKKVNDDYAAALSALDDTILSQTQDIGTRYYPPGSFGVDPVNRKFLPVRIGGAKAVTPTDQVTNPTITPPAVNHPDNTASPIPFTMTQPDSQPAATSFGNPFSGISGLFGARSGPSPDTSIAPQPQRSIRRMIGNTSFLITPEDDAFLKSQMSSIPADQQPHAYSAIVNDWLNAGRAQMAGRAPSYVPFF